MATEEYVVGPLTNSYRQQVMDAFIRDHSGSGRSGVTKIAPDLFSRIDRNDISAINSKLGTTKDVSRNGKYYTGSAGETIASMHKRLIKELGITDERWGPGEFSMESQYGQSNQFMNSFNRYYKIFPNEEIDGMLSYVFMVRPDLNLNSAMEADPYFLNLSHKTNTVLQCLTHDDAVGASHHFIPFLVDRVEQYQLPDFNLKTYDIEQPFSTFKMQHGGNSNESRSGASCSITFRDNKNLDVTNLFEAWVRYIDGLSLNKFYPKDQYIQAVPTEGTAVIDYATSVYYIKTRADGEIVFFHKTTGLFPTVVPHSNWSFALRGSPDVNVTIEFAGGFPEAFSPRLLAEFNYNAGIITIDESDLHGAMTVVDNSTTNFAHYSNPIVGVPFITCNPNRGSYHLRWRPLE